MNLVFCFDERFAPGFVSAVVSLCANNPGHHLLFALHDGLSEGNKKKIQKRIAKYDCELRYINIGKGYFEREPYKSMPRYQKLSMARLLIHKYLPNSMDRVLYLDVDMTINGSIEEFYKTDFDNNALVTIGVRRDGADGGPFWDQEAGVYDVTRIPLKPQALYFNAGVLLINLSVFRRLHPTDYDHFVIDHLGELCLADQDILNLFFENDSIKIVDRRMNCTIPNNMRLRRGEYKWIKKEVKILHYVVAKKPWMYTKYTNPLFKIYMHYYRLEAGTFSWLYRYGVWYALKPLHFFGHCWRKGISIILSLVGA